MRLIGLLICSCVSVGYADQSIFLAKDDSQAPAKSQNSAPFNPSLEERITRLEQDAGLDVRKERTTGFAYGEFIFWQPSLDGVAYATTAEVVVSPTGVGTSLNDFRARTVDFDYIPAFEIGLGVGLPRDYWDLSASWLRSVSTGRNSTQGSLTETVGQRVILDSIGLIEDLSDFPNQSSARCRVNLNIVDFSLGRTFVWSRYFWFRLYGGLRGVFTTLDWRVDFTRPFTIPDAALQTSTVVRIDNHYSAGGFLGGFDTKWNLYKGFGVFSKAAAALVFGKSSEKTNQQFSALPAGDTTVIDTLYTASNSATAMKGIFAISLGLKWEFEMTQRSSCQLWAGWEFLYLPNIAQKTIVQQSRIRDRTDLSFEGLILGARMDF